MNKNDEINKTKNQIRGAFTEKEILSFKKFDDFLDNVINFLEKSPDILKRNQTEAARKFLIEDYKKITNATSSDDTVFLINLLTRNRLEYPNLFIQLYSLKKSKFRGK